MSLRMTVLLLALLSAGPLPAQSVAAAGDAVMRDPSLSSAFAQSISQLSLVSSQDSTAVRAEIGWAVQAEKGRWLTSLRLQQPLQKDADEQVLADLSGLSGGGTTAGLTVTRVSYGARFDSTALDKVCESYNGKVAAPPTRLSTCSAETVRAAIRKLPDGKVRGNAEGVRTAAVIGALREVCRAINKAGVLEYMDVENACVDEHDVARTAQEADRALADRKCAAGEPACTEKNLFEKQLQASLEKAYGDFCAAWNSDPVMWGHLATCSSRALEEAGPEWGELARSASRIRPVYYSAGVTLRNDTFKYVTDSIADEQSAAKQSSAFTVSAGRLFLGGNWYVGASGSIEHAFKGARATQLCGVLPDSTLTQCKTIARSAPTRETGEILRLEARHLLNQHFAVAPRVSRDFKKDVNGAELIAYFFTAKAGGLNGGVNLGYRDDKDQPIVTVFIGVPFKLFGD